MKSAKTKTSQKNQPKPFYKQPWFLPVVITAALLAFLVAAQYNQEKKQTEEKAQFESAYQSLEKVYSKIVDEVGKPAKTEKYKYCSRPHLKYSEGDPRCDVGIKFVYGVAGPARANHLMHSIGIIISKDANLILLKNNPSYRDSFDKNVGLGEPNLSSYEESSSSYKLVNNALECSSSYRYGPGGSPFINPRTKSKKYNLAIDLSCGSKTISEYYTME